MCSSTPIVWTFLQIPPQYWQYYPLVIHCPHYIISSSFSYSTIFETEFIVDQQKIQEENFKLTVLQDYNTSSNRSRGGAINMASTFLGAKHPGNNNNNTNNINNANNTGYQSNVHHTMHTSNNLHNNVHNERGDMGVTSANSSVTGSLSTYSRSQGQQRIVRYCSFYVSYVFICTVVGWLMWVHRMVLFLLQHSYIFDYISSFPTYTFT